MYKLKAQLKSIIFVSIYLTVCCGASDIHLEDDVPVELQSYNFPNTYPNNMNCIWFVTALNGGVVMVQFLDFDTEIRFDYFSLGFGHDDISEESRVLYMTGPWSPISVISDGPRLWIRFQTDVSKSGRGINLHLRRLQSQGNSFHCFFHLYVTTMVILVSPQ